MYMLVNCGFGEIDSIVPAFVSNIVKVLQFGIPIVLIVLGMVDLGKAVISSDDKEMKNAQKTLIKRVIYAVLIFFIVAIVKFVFSLLASTDSNDDSNKKDFSKCIDCFVNYTDANCKS